MKKTVMREKIVLRWRTYPRVVILPNGTTFTARYERISRKQLPINIHVKNARKIGPRNNNNNNKKNRTNDICKKKLHLYQHQEHKTGFVEFAGFIKKHARMKKRQSGKGMASNLAKIGLTIGSKAVNSSFGKKLINKDIDNIPNIFKCRISKIKNKNIK